MSAPTARPAAWQLNYVSYTARDKGDPNLVRWRALAFLPPVSAAYPDQKAWLDRNYHAADFASAQALLVQMGSNECNRQDVNWSVSQGTMRCDWDWNEVCWIPRFSWT